MQLNSIEDIHKALGYTTADATTLKGVRKIWQALEAAKAKASKGESKALKTYHDLLLKTLPQVRKMQPVEDPEAESRKLWDWYAEQCQASGIPELESKRGQDHLSWCEKWLAKEYAEFDAATARIVEMPSLANFSEFMTAATKMLKAYVEKI